MPRKVKAVPVEQTELKVESEPVVEIPNDVHIPSPVVDSDNESIKIEDIQPIQEPNDKMYEEIVEKDTKTKTKKVPTTGVCDQCGKTMLLKNLKYAHPKVCKNRPRPPSPPPPPPPNVIIDKVVVQVNNKPDVVYSNNTVQEPTPQEKYKMSKLLKVETRNQKLKSLIANAF